MNLRFRKIPFILAMAMFTVFEKSHAGEIVSILRVTQNPIRYEKIEFDMEVKATFINPFDQKDITVDLSFTDPDGLIVLVPCYFTSGNNTLSKWKARFAPRKAGTYAVDVIVKKNDVTDATLSGPGFTVANSAEGGFLHHKNNWILEFDSGKPFRGLGENFGWEPLSLDGRHTYDYLLPHLKNQGVNFFRSWMCNWNFPLEWKTVGSPRYANSGAYFNPSGIERMDEVIDMIDSLDLKMMLAFDYHGAFMTNTAWALNNYNSANGGPVATPAEFFTSAAAKAMYKNRLRYIVARWGYSTGIAVWEFFNEVDNAMYNGETVIISHASVTQWHTEMSAYLKSIDPYDHVVSTSISHRQINGLFSVPDIDINQQHIYKFTGNIPGMLSNNTTGKPFVIGEFGYEWDWNIDFQTIASELDFDFKRGLWYGLFNPTPILPMSWWWEFFNDRSTDTYFSAVRQINDHMLSVGNGSFTKMNTTSPGGGIELFAVKCGNQYFVCAINTTTASSTNKTISLAVTADNTFSVKGFDPENLAYHDIGTVTSVSKSLQIGGLSFSSRESKIFIVTAQGDIQGLQVPFDTDPFSIPGQIEVEHFDFGGEGISYHDLEAVNLGGAYRTTEGVDVEDGNGGKIVSHTVTGEWLEYTVNVQKRATYNLEFTLASAAAGNSFQVVLDEKVIATVDVPVTGDLQTWQVMSLTTPALDAGVQHLKILFTSSGFNIDKLNFSLANIAPEVSLASPLNGAIVTLPEMVDFNVTASDEDGTLTSVEFYDGLDKIGEDDSAPYAWSWQGTVGQHKLSAVAIDDEGLSTTESVNVRISPSTVQTPFHGTASEIPGKIEAEDLDMGAGGIACFDLTAGNIKGQYRSDTEADIEVCTDEGGGFNLADIQNSEWVEYTVHVADAGKYDFDFRVATQMSGQKFKVALNGQAVGSIAVPNTGTWQTWKTVTLPKVLMPAGEVVLRLTFESEYFNLNYINVRKSVVTDIMEEEIPEAVLYPNPADHEFKLVPGARAEQFSVFDVAGRKVFSSTVSRQPEVTFGSQLHPGIYMVLVAYNGNQYQWIKAVKRD